MPKQPNFPSLRNAMKKKRTRQEIFLSEMDAVVPWVRLLKLIEPHYPKTGPKGGRPPMPLETMLRVNFLQNWYALSDPMAEDTLYDSEAMRRFAGIELGDDRIPDETTILNFRHLLERHGLTEAIFVDVSAHLADKGITPRGGTLTDERDYQLRDGLGFRFTRTSRLMQRHYERLLAELGLSRIMWCVLVMRGLYGIQSPSAMADYLDVDRAVISRILGAMDRKGMISRIALDGDKRSRDVHLTDLGRQKLEAFLPRAMETGDYFRSKLTEEEFQQLNLILDKMMEGEEGALPSL